MFWYFYAFSFGLWRYQTLPQIIIVSAITQMRPYVPPIVKNNPNKKLSIHAAFTIDIFLHCIIESDKDSLYHWTSNCCRNIPLIIDRAFRNPYTLQFQNSYNIEGIYQTLFKKPISIHGVEEGCQLQVSGILKWAKFV